MASYKSNLPTAGTGGGSPTFQRGTFTWVTSTATKVTIPISSKWFINTVYLNSENTINLNQNILKLMFDLCIQYCKHID